MQNSNDWIEEGTSKQYIKCYKYEDFRNIQCIGKGGFGEVYRVNRRDSEQCFALKSLINLDNVTIEELEREVITNTIIYH